MKIGIACGYSWDVAGGVQIHIRDLAEELISRGHEVTVIAPSEKTEDLEPYVVPVGAAVPIRYNGSVARLAFGPKVNRQVRAWLKDENLDVLHVHEPFTPSVSMLALMSAHCPIVSTFHTAMDRSRAMALSAPVLVPMLDKIQARIAVSEEARRTAVQHLGGDAWVIPNGVRVSQMRLEHKDPRFIGTPERPTLAFLGRLDEPRKGLPLVAQALPKVLEKYPNAHLFIAGRGDIEKAHGMFGEYAKNIEFLGGVSDSDKAALLGSADLYLAPNTGGESFGIILVEAMSAGACIVASDIPAFRAVLQNGKCGFHFENENPVALADAINEALEDVNGRLEKSRNGEEHAEIYDWGTVASQIYEVYETAIKMQNSGIE
ncbi:glycosyltransferase family 4 protein [Arcanobacterium ihumii]|uniref:glycosyltransferase family 4 protein n=1 Tax=Arcanobacterium ihumii TaxID=2138162 RepID=UPI000F54007C|nr:glycosyltransferase family 4 protein [Arcanobacterium ihumii]